MWNTVPGSERILSTLLSGQFGFNLQGQMMVGQEETVLN